MMKLNRNFRKYSLRLLRKSKRKRKKLKLKVKEKMVESLVPLIRRLKKEIS